MSAEQIRDFFSGRIARSFLVTKLIPLIMAILVATILVGNIIYPGPYDWRYVVISALSSSEDNPNGYLIPSIGMSAAGFLFIPMVGYYYRRLSKICKGPTITGTIFLIIAVFGMISIGTIGVIITSIEKFHEILAVFAFLGVLFAAFFFWFPMAKDHKKGKQQFNYKIMLAGAAVLWTAFFGMLMSFGVTELNDWDWVGLEWIDEGIPAVFSFAFWEWILLISIITYVLLLALMTPETVEPFPKKNKK